MLWDVTVRVRVIKKDGRMSDCLRRQRKSNKCSVYVSYVVYHSLYENNLRLWTKVIHTLVWICFESNS